MRRPLEASSKKLAVLTIHYNRLPGVVFWAGNIGGIVNGPLWSLPCEALLYLMLFGLGL